MIRDRQRTDGGLSIRLCTMLQAAVLCLLIIPAAAQAEQTETHVCTLTDQTRRMDRVFEPGGAPCSVRYYRNAEPVQTLWQARETGQVCIDAIDRMKRNFEAQGYSCTGGDTGGGGPGGMPAAAPRSGQSGQPDHARAGGQSMPSQAPAQNLCYAVTYQTCAPGQGDCRAQPASICLQSDNRWLLTDGIPSGLDPASRFLPGDPGKCYRVYRNGEALPLCTENAGSLTTVWSLR
ncbi:hypothetical protein JL100_017290 [Skermanella mucosa]|uniref:hypothetical protein n=1 Tax=Skermanella mucosa TaxID=1789672 RepID=UPI00192C8404|nr:hypothetical protein [Skermanella mucosa]UEM18846.1 hypothetical protein JL100_017290 [Skermanella mucosa]